MKLFQNSIHALSKYFQYELSNDIDREHIKISEHEHLDHDNQHTFEIEDLKKLILKTSNDLAEADKKRREEFKVRNSIHKIKIKLFTTLAIPKH